MLMWVCRLCCPTNYTEDYYDEHPEKYPTHPPTFLIQTELDSGADSCAARHYHETMIAHGAHSELGIVPLNEQRCFSIGDPGDPAVPAADRWSRFCASPNVRWWSLLDCCTPHLADLERITISGHEPEPHARVCRRGRAHGEVSHAGTQGRRAGESRRPAR